MCIEKIVRKIIKYPTHLNGRDEIHLAVVFSRFFFTSIGFCILFETYNLSSILNQYISLYVFKHFMFALWVSCFFFFFRLISFRLVLKMQFLYSRAHHTLYSTKFITSSRLTTRLRLMLDNSCHITHTHTDTGRERETNTAFALIDPCFKQFIIKCSHIEFNESFSHYPIICVIWNHRKLMCVFHILSVFSFPFRSGEWKWFVDKHLESHFLNSACTNIICISNACI